MVRANHTMLIEDNSLQSKTQPSVKPSIQSAMEAVSEVATSGCEQSQQGRPLFDHLVGAREQSWVALRGRAPVADFVTGIQAGVLRGPGMARIDRRGGWPPRSL